LNKIVVDLLFSINVDEGNIDLHFEVSHFHVLNSPLEVDGIGVVKVNIFIGEESEGILHESIDGSLGMWVID
jgi:hypothetical protein